MTVTVIPTLEVMADVYRHSREGGANSPRFRAYTTVGMSRAPVGGYNPMTSKPVLETVESLISFGAERIAADAAREWAGRLGVDADVELFITVATPGMWTDRVASEAEHRLAPTPWTGGGGSILLWTGEDTSEAAVRREAAAQTVRMCAPAATVAQAAGREGLAYAPSGEPRRLDDAVSDAIEILGPDTTLASKVAVLYGDDWASAMGFAPVGLAPLAGYRHAVAVAAREVEASGPRAVLQRLLSQE